MRKFIISLALITLAAPVFAAQNQAYLGLFVETSQTKMAGMSMPALPPGMDMEKLSKMPGMEKMASMFGGAPTRKLEVRLWSPSIAPANASAVIACPEGLKQGDKLILDIYRPEPVKSEGDKSGKTDEGNFDIGKMTIKYYWGSSPTVKPGQPKVFTFGNLTPEQKARMKEQQAKAQKGGSEYFYKPDWTTAYWPTKKQPGQIAKDAKMLGNYALTTNYTGNVAIDCPTNVNFLDGIDMTSPEMGKISLEDPIEFKWKPIPNLLGSIARITGMEGKNTIIIWSSSEVWEDDMMSIDWDYMQMADVKKLVASTVMMKGDDTNATVPEGIFKNCDMANMQMTGYGIGTATAETNPLARIQTKTTLSMMLGGKAMEGMGDMPDMPDMTDGGSEE